MNTDMHQNIKEVLISEEQIKVEIEKLAKLLKEDYKDKNPLIVGILKGALPFMADLIKEMDIFLEYDMMDVSSYGTATKSSGEVKILKDLDSSVDGRHILIVEDIIDTGRTLSYLQKMFKNRNAASVKLVTLLDKPSGRDENIELTVDYKCFDIPDAFVVGYGLDYFDNYRNLPYIGVLKEEIYK